VVVVNSFYHEFKGLKATAKIYNLDMTEKFSQQAALDIAPDGSQRVFTLPAPADLTPTYFVKLTLEDRSGKLTSENFYWLSTKPDTLGRTEDRVGLVLHADETVRGFHRAEHTSGGGFGNFRHIRTQRRRRSHACNGGESRQSPRVLRSSQSQPTQKWRGDPAGDLAGQLFFAAARRETRSQRDLRRGCLARRRIRVELNGWNVMPKTVSASR